jgi:thiol-disulfide isomerase/thioredoxin
MKTNFIFPLLIVFAIVMASCGNQSNNQSGDNGKATEKTSVAQTPPKASQPVKVEETQSKPKSQQMKKVEEKNPHSSASGEIEIGNEVGNDLGEFVSYDPDSTLLKLSDYRGKLTMVILWNSLCGHCVTENKKHIDVYNEYHDKQFVNGDGFEIFAIALDKERATWVEHLEKMNYPWKGNVYVIDSWKDPDIRFFGIKNLPGTFLIDENGIVVAKLFTSTELKKLLKDRLKK